MPKNTKGGKKHKQLKNSNMRSQQLNVRDTSGYQFYAIVEKYYGHNADVKYIKEGYERNSKGENIPDGTRELISTKAIIRGTIAKKCRLKTGDILLISIRDYDTKKVDVIYKYSNEEIKELSSANEFDTEFIKLSSHYNSESSNKRTEGIDNLEDIDNQEDMSVEVEFTDNGSYEDYNNYDNYNQKAFEYDNI
jgi:translation initiation factor 1A